MSFVRNSVVYLNVTNIDLNHFRQHDRLVSINGVQINSKIDLIVNLAKFEQCALFVIVVIDKITEDLFGLLNLSVTEELGK